MMLAIAINAYTPCNIFSGSLAHTGTLVCVCVCVCTTLKGIHPGSLVSATRHGGVKTSGRRQEYSAASRFCSSRTQSRTCSNRF